jgi:hypothetical protein
MPTGWQPARPSLATGARPVDTLSLTYGELADRLGIEREAARQLVKRRGWPKWKSNEDQQVRVSVPEQWLTSRPETGFRPDDETGAEPVENRVEPGVLSVLTRHIERLEAQLDEAQKRAGEIALERDEAVSAAVAERDTARSERDAARSERDRVQAEKDIVTTQVEALRAALAAAEQDRDRWHQAATNQPRRWWQWRRAG